VPARPPLSRHAADLVVGHADVDPLSFTRSLGDEVAERVAVGDDLFHAVSLPVHAVAGTDVSITARRN